MTIKNDITALCKQIAGDYEEWTYSTTLFKRKIDKNITVFVDMSWSFRSGGAACEPYAGLYLPNIEKVWKSMGKNHLTGLF